jgi:ubiquinone/menaquinone biosynthesis C-methylase UbiE
MLPKLIRPRILDIGSGTGVSTLEVAQISDGSIVAVDEDRAALDILSNRFKTKGLADRIETLQVSMEEMMFPPHSFELIWSEGAIATIGFERGLNEWRDFLVPEGYHVVHDVITDLKRKTELIRTCGYALLGQFELSQEIWWNEFYEPLSKQLEKYRGMDSLSERIKHEMRVAEQEIEAFEYDDDRFASVFFVLRRQDKST